MSGRVSGDQWEREQFQVEEVEMVEEAGGRRAKRRQTSNLMRRRRTEKGNEPHTDLPTRTRREKKTRKRRTARRRTSRASGASLLQAPTPQSNPRVMPGVAEASGGVFVIYGDRGGRVKGL